MGRREPHRHGLEEKHCTKKRCSYPHTWWSRLRQHYFWCPGR